MSSPKLIWIRLSECALFTTWENVLLQIILIITCYYITKLPLVGVNITLIILHKKDSSKPKLRAISGEFI